MRPCARVEPAQHPASHGHAYWNINADHRIMAWECCRCFRRRRRDGDRAASWLGSVDDGVSGAGARVTPGVFAAGSGSALRMDGRSPKRTRQSASSSSADAITYLRQRALNVHRNHSNALPSLDHRRHSPRRPCQALRRFAGLVTVNGRGDGEWVPVRRPRRSPRTSPQLVESRCRTWHSRPLVGCQTGLRWTVFGIDRW
jgi:hypothetical protein